MDHPDYCVSNFMENSIRPKRVEHHKSMVESCNTSLVLLTCVMSSPFSIFPGGEYAV